MPKITYNTHDNQTHTINVQNGLTVMEGAIQNDIPGIDADCGGGAVCGTCHCFVEKSAGSLPTVDPQEESMLGLRPDRESNSRLS